MNITIEKKLQVCENREMQWKALETVVLQLREAIEAIKTEK